MSEHHAEVGCHGTLCTPPSTTCGRRGERQGSSRTAAVAPVERPVLPRGVAVGRSGCPRSRGFWCLNRAVGETHLAWQLGDGPGVVCLPRVGPSWMTGATMRPKDDGLLHAGRRATSSL